ncbi:plasma membrane t-SNARE secretory vesicle fusion [Penicillium maclennaniae]|uniref:plasma membrane t-SNARE secretory vesicle fusion n=1 Tax=Penicillium maclennaniae TaxID=1343394 RepID=UPI002541A107|nr:plasma membrane t-SNARE secretory vesicle fusion [Penicillium maclennaniae]KAJ5670576.1 plasma membrane t-SNARE secretory vesicle fusion [Penicillium maclennaniae]
MSFYNQRAPDLESNQVQYELQPRSGMAINLAKRREIEEQLDHIISKQAELRPAQQALLNSTTSTEDQQCRLHIESIGSDIIGYFGTSRNLLAILKRESNPDDWHAQTQIQYISDKIRKEIEAYRLSQRDFDRQMRSQVRRRYEIAHEDATPEEIDQGVENVIMGQEQVFSVQGQRSQHASEARAAVIQRSAAIRKIEQDLITLAELSQEVAELVHQQESAVVEIEQTVNQTHENLQKANTHLDMGIQSVRNARKWKWWALFICLLIVLIVVVVAVVYCSLSHSCSVK